MRLAPYESIVTGIITKMNQHGRVEVRALAKNNVQISGQLNGKNLSLTLDEEGRIVESTFGQRVMRYFQVKPFKPIDKRLNTDIWAREVTDDSHKTLIVKHSREEGTDVNTIKYTKNSDGTADLHTSISSYKILSSRKKMDTLATATIHKSSGSQLIQIDGDTWEMEDGKLVKDASSKWVRNQISETEPTVEGLKAFYQNHLDMLEKLD